MITTQEIKLCSFVKDETVEMFLKTTFGLSKSQLKKQGLAKNFLNKNLRQKEEIGFNANLVNYGKINPNYQGPEPKVLFEDNLLLAISKPSNIHCHPLTYCEHDNILSYLAQIEKFESLRVNINHYDRGLMYRLDKDTSGLLIFIKDENSYQEMRENFHALVDEKIYYAVVSGAYEGEQDLQTLLKTSGPKGRKIIEDETHNAETKFSRLEIIERRYHLESDETLLKIKLFHGHRHQIRAQLRASGYPIKGDSLYAGKKADRLYLHCYRYKFKLNNVDYNIKDEDVHFLSKFFDSNS